MAGKIDTVMALAVMEAMRLRFAEQHAQGTCTIMELQRSFAAMLVQMKHAEEELRRLHAANGELRQHCVNLASTHPMFVLAAAMRAP